MKRAIFIWILMLVFLVATLSQVQALGVAPSRKVIDYTPGEQTYTARIINTNHKEMHLALYPKGELAKYVTLEKDIVHMDATESEKTFRYAVNLPNDVSPGPQTIGIVVIELPDTFADPENNLVVSDGVSVIFEGKSDDTLVGATLAVIHQLQIDVPYPGDFIEGQLFVSEAQTGDDVVFTMSLNNKGSTAQEAYADIVIKGPTNEELAKVKTNTVVLPASGEGKAIAVWTSTLPAGTYAVEATLHYAGKFVKLNKIMSLGNKFIDVTNVEVKNFRLGGIAQFDVFLENKWNEQISGVYGELEILDASGNRLSKFNTLNTDIDPYGEATINGYWDTTGVDIGTYDVNVILHYAGKTSEKMFQAIVGLDAIEMVGAQQLAGRVIGQEGGGVNLTAILIAVVVLLIIINVGWFMYFKKKKN